jgi:hypothetical protein
MERERRDRDRGIDIGLHRERRELVGRPRVEPGGATKITAQLEPAWQRNLAVHELGRCAELRDRFRVHHTVLVQQAATRRRQVTREARLIARQLELRVRGGDATVPDDHQHE